MQSENKKLIANIIDRIEVMRSIFDQVGIKKDHFSFCIEKEGLEDLDTEFLEVASDWIDTVYILLYGDILQIKKLLSEETWKRYQTWGGFEEHRECVLLRGALDRFKEMITSKDRPDFFKKGKLDAKLKSTKSKGRVSEPTGEKDQYCYRKSRKSGDKEQPDCRKDSCHHGDHQK